MAATCKVCRRDYDDHMESCRFCGRPPEHHAAGDIELEREGRRRMAAARRASGQPLDKTDLEVLDP